MLEQVFIILLGCLQVRITFNVAVSKKMCFGSESIDVFWCSSTEHFINNSVGVHL